MSVGSREPVNANFHFAIAADALISAFTIVLDSYYLLYAMAALPDMLLLLINAAVGTPHPS